MEENTCTYNGGSSPKPNVRHAENESALEDGLRFLREFKNAKLFVPFRAKSKEGAKGYSMAVLSTQNGEMFLPAFTSWDELPNGHMKKVKS
jgi:hypothetical protein